MYVASETRYDKMIYNKCGNSGLKSASPFLWECGTISAP